jgi:arylsulfatase A-like enzyme
MKLIHRVFAVLAAVLATGALSRMGAFYQKDAQTFFYPSKLAWREQVLSGHLPTWLPLADLGAPFIADPSHSALYPFNMIALLPAPWGVTFMVMLHLLLAAVGAYLVGRALGISPRGAMVAAASFGWSGYVCSMTWNCTYLLGLAYMPWVGWSALRCGRSRNLGAIATLGLVSGLQLLTGELQSAVFSWALAVCLVVFDPVRDGTASARRVLAVATGLSLGVVTALPLLLPAWQFLQTTTRAAGISPAEAGLWSLDPRRLVELVCAWFFGDASRRDLYLGLFLDDPTNRLSPWAASLYFGSLSLLLGISALGKRGTHRYWTWALASLAGIALLLSFGEHTPLYGLMHRVLPGASFFRYPVKWFSVVTLCWALLAGHGTDKIALAPRFVCLFVGVLGLSLLVLSLAASPIGAYLVLQRPVISHSTATLIVRTALCIEGGGLLLAALLLELFRRRWPEKMTLCAALLVLGQVTLLNGRILALGPADLYTAPPALARALGGSDAGNPPRVVTARVHPPVYVPCIESFSPREEASWRSRSLASNTAQGWGMGHVGAYHALVSVRNQRMLDRATHLGRPLFDLFSVPYAVLPKDFEPLAKDNLSVISRDCVTLVRSRTTAPFAFVAKNYISVPRESDPATHLSRSEVSNLSAVIVEAPWEPEQGTAWTPSAALNSSGTPCRISRPAPSMFRAECLGPGVAVVNEAYHSQWQATLDGKPVEVHPANAAVMGVDLPPGWHKLEMEYTEPMLALGLAIMAAVWSVFFVFGMALRQRRKHRAAAALMVLAVFAVGCKSPPAENNLILVSVDTLRHDKIGLHGHQPTLTPHLDRYFQQASIGMNAYAAAPCTVPSIKQILTGVLAPRLEDDRLTDVLKNRGYETAAFVSHYVFGVQGHYSLHYARGFDIFDVQTQQELGPENLSTRTADVVVDRALGWLGQRDESRPLFLWLHLFDPHDPYAPPGDDWKKDPALAMATHESSKLGLVRETIRAVAGNAALGRNKEDTSWMRAAPHMPEADRNALRTLYEKEISHTDKVLDRLWQHLDRSGLTRRSLVVFTSDHGEQLGEQGAWLHCLSLEDTELEVPLMFRWRGGPLESNLSKLTAPVSTLDIFPTVLARLGISVRNPQRLFGRSWLSSGLSGPVTAYWGKDIVVRDAAEALRWRVDSPAPEGHKLWPAMQRAVEELSSSESRVPVEQLRALGYIQ